MGNKRVFGGLAFMRGGKELSYLVAAGRGESVYRTFDNTDQSPEGTVWYRMVTVTPIPPYNRCWFVLQEVNGRSVLGAVDGMGESAMVIPVLTERCGKRAVFGREPKKCW